MSELYSRRISRLPPALRAAIAGALAVACGGNTAADPEPVGPVRTGKGEYDLSIETLEDDCAPPFISGEIGSVVVWVVTRSDSDTAPVDGANIPVYGTTQPPQPTPARWDVAFHEPLVLDLPILVAPPCDAAHQHIEIETLRADSTGIDIAFENEFGGIETCTEEPTWATKDCTSRRVYHFRWRRSCEPDGESDECQ